MLKFDHIAIIGGGLIGSSIARAVHQKMPETRLTIVENSDPALETLKSLNLADHVATSCDESLKTADLIVLATPPGTMGDVARALQPFLKLGSIVTDVGSVKGDIVKAVAPYIPDGVHFIPGHPIAGTENSGPEAGFASLFEGRWCILTPAADMDEQFIARLKGFWHILGSDVEIMSPERHDLILATTSHVPHLIAYTLVGTAMDMETVTRNEVVKFSAGGFRDFTRIAASDPAMWRDVFIQNRESVLEVVDRFIEDLTALKRSIRWEEGDNIYRSFEKGRDIRRRIIDAHQDSDIPNFGRDQS